MSLLNIKSMYTCQLKELWKQKDQILPRHNTYMNTQLYLVDT